MNIRNKTKRSLAKRLLSILLSLLLLCSTSGGAAEALVEPLQAAAAAVQRTLTSEPVLYKSYI